MINRTLVGVSLLLGALLMAACPEQAEVTSVDQALQVADESHEGHDHASHAEPAVQADPHAGHDHAADGPDAPDARGGDAEEVGAISLSAEKIRELGIASAPAGPGSLGRELVLTGEVAINEDTVTHVSPRIGGIVSKVYRSLGDHIEAGAPLLELDSIELAQAKSEYLALLSRVELARQTVEREEMLQEKGISAEQDCLAARQAYDELLIAERSAEQTLSAMGLSEQQISGLPDEQDASLTAYTVRAPVGGEIIEKHASLGEMMDSTTEAFTIGDLSTVWVRLNVHQPDFLDVREGMEVLIDAGHGLEPVRGAIDYIEPLIGEETRTAVARVVLSRSSHLLRPGLFVTGLLEVGGDQAELVVPRSAVVSLDQDQLIFVRRAESFEPRLVSIGRQTATSSEVLAGIQAGEEIVVAGAFQLKAELLKGTFDPHAGHAH